MLEIKFIRENQDLVREALEKRKSSFDLDAFLALDEKRRVSIQQVDELRSRQNALSAQVKQLLKEKKDPKDTIAQSKELSAQMVTVEQEFRSLKSQFETQLLTIPNIPDSNIPVGGESANALVREEGALPSFNFKPLSHIELGQQLDILDFKRAAKITGSNFCLFKGDAAKLERSLIDFMIDIHTNKHGYKEIFPPFLVNRTAMTGTGQLPNLEEDMYALRDDGYFLIPTAEVPVTNMYSDEVLEEEQLPLRHVAYTPCFRREAGSYGKETRGLVRVHQFDKVEMVKMVKPEWSDNELEVLLANACSVLELLGLSYRVLLLSTQEISFAAAKCYDIEIYAPGIEQWLEVSSCSNFRDFQARRANIKYRDKATGKARFVHTLNGSGVALARLMIAIMETYQQEDGSILIPPPLRKYFNGREALTK